MYIFYFSQGMLSLLSKCIDRMNLYDSAAHFGEVAGEEAGAAWKDILNLLYELLGKQLSDGSHEISTSFVFFFFFFLKTLSAVGSG